MGYLISPIFGDGRNGDGVINSSIVSSGVSCTFTGTAGSTTGSGTHTSFSTNLPFPAIIHQTQGTNAGQWERNYVIGYSPGTITFAIPLSNTYTTGAQITLILQNRSLLIDSSGILTPIDYGTIYGICALCVSGRLTINGTINGVGRGFDGGAGGTTQGFQGQGTNGTGGASTAANGNGGGGGTGDNANKAGGGGGGGHVASGTVGTATSGTVTGGAGGGSVGSADLTTTGINLGGGGGGAGRGTGVSGNSGWGGNGGGIVIIYAREIVINSGGLIDCSGDVGQNGTIEGGGGGGGAGGSVLIYTVNATIGNNRVKALGGAGGSGGNGGINGGNGGAGANGRIAIAKGIITDSGTTNPSFTDKGYQSYCGIVGRE